VAEGENMRLALIAILFSLAIAIGIYAVSQDQRTKMIAAFRKNKPATAEKILLAVFSYAVPIYLLLYVDSCSQWTAIE
jgi:hypothetical protein